MKRLPLKPFGPGLDPGLSKPRTERSEVPSTSLRLTLRQAQGERMGEASP